jgi:hypothetical protein
VENLFKCIFTNRSIFLAEISDKMNVAIDKAVRIAKSEVSKDAKTINADKQ